MAFANVGLRAKIMLAVIIPMWLVVIFLVIGAQSVRTLLSSLAYVEQSNKVIAQSMRVQEGAVSMETSMRGFLLTGDEKFLDRYTDNERSIFQQFASLKEAVAGDPNQVKLLDRTEEIIRLWKKTCAEPMIALRREIGQAKDMNDLGALVAEGSERKHFRKLRDQMQSFISNEQRILETRKSEAASATDSRQALDLIYWMNQSHLAIEQAIGVLAACYEIQSGLQGYLLAGKEEFLQPYHSGSARLFALVEQLRESVAANASQTKLLQELERDLNEWIKNFAEPQIALRKQIAGSKTMVDMRAIVSKGEDKILFDKFRQMMGSFREKETNLMQDRRKSADSLADLTQKLILGGTVVVVLASLVISYLLSGAIIRPLTKVVGLAETISGGNLSVSLDVTGRDEVGRLGAAFNAMTESLRKQSLTILKGVKVLGNCSSEILATVSQLSASIQKTSAAVMETITTVEQLKQAARTAGEKANKVAHDSQRAVQISLSGHNATEDTLAGMELINTQMESIDETVVKLSEHSRSIEGIIGSVQDLADQSNLLAVNASIEAARAGDQGRGFAVVAHEIKILADQSKTATNKAASILNDVQSWVSAAVMATEQGRKAVESGLSRSSQAGDSINSLQQVIEESANSANVIKASTEQQFAGVDQASLAMTSIEQAMQQSIEGVERLEEHVRKLSAVGTELNEYVGRYKI